MDKRLLLIEDDPSIQEVIALHIEALGLDLDWEANGKTGLERALHQPYALIILDIQLPGAHGIEVCRSLRKAGIDTPILMLTSRTDEADKALGLDSGADDYLTKPFGVVELSARIRALLRRSNRGAVPSQDSSGANETVTFSELVIDFARRKVSIKGVVLDLTRIEFDFLAFLVRHPGRPFTREQLLNAIWEYETSGYDNAVNSLVNRLRQKMEIDPRDPRYIKTVWGIGYRFAELEELVDIVD